MERDEDHIVAGPGPASVVVTPLVTVRHSPSFAEIAVKLAAFQVEFYSDDNTNKLEKTRTARVRTKSGGEFDYKYASLSDVCAAVIPILAKNGIATLSVTKTIEGRMILYTRLVHKEEWFECEWPIARQGEATDQQALGAATSYARKYCICSMAGVAPDEDIDGNELEPSGKKPRAKPEVIRTEPVSGPRPPPPRVGE